MNWLDNFTVRARLWGAFGLVLALLAVIVALGIRSGLKTEAELSALVEQEMRKYELAANINAATRSNARNTLQLFVVMPEQRGPVRENMARTKAAIDADFERLAPLLLLPQGRALFEDIKVKRTAYVAAFTEAAHTLEQRGNEAGLAILNGKVLPAIDALAQPIEALLALQLDLAHQRANEAEEAVRFQTRFNVALGILAVLIGLGAAWSLVTSIMRPLAIAEASTRVMAQGDLTMPIPISGRNELSAMMEALDHMRENLGHVLMRIQENANHVASASSEIAAANLDLSGRTEEQASALEETAATMEELTSTVQHNSHTTSQARDMAEQASRSARGVGDLVSHVVRTMHDIHDSSQRIRDIVSVIDSIAFQTNILALNAAVEAARAGDQGRGFAVVASEVRALAQRSASAAHEIKGIIEDNVAKMDTGNDQAVRAGEAVSEAVHSIEAVSVTIAEVDSASKEQSMGISQVGEAVGQMDMVTQQNAALVEETAAATKNLDDQVQGLKAQINRFRIH